MNYLIIIREEINPSVRPLFPSRHFPRKRLCPSAIFLGAGMASRCGRLFARDKRAAAIWQNAVLRTSSSVLSPHDSLSKGLISQLLTTTFGGKNTHRSGRVRTRRLQERSRFCNVIHL